MLRPQPRMFRSRRRCNAVSMSFAEAATPERDRNGQFDMLHMHCALRPAHRLTQAASRQNNGPLVSLAAISPCRVASDFLAKHKGRWPGLLPVPAACSPLNRLPRILAHRRPET